MRRKIKNALSQAVCLVLLVSLAGCSGVWQQAYRTQLDDQELARQVGRIIDEHYDTISPYLEEGAKAQADGLAIACNALGEANGRSYLDYCYTVSSDPSIETAVEASKALISEEQYSILKQRAQAAEKRLVACLDSKSVPDSQAEAFAKDLRRLVTRTVVLLTAGIVYACLPKTVLWGKITAAAAISVAAGIVASTVLSIYEYYKYDRDAGQFFKDWLTEITMQPEADYALGASIIAIGDSLSRGPVVTGIIVCVFGIYQVMDMVKPMLEKYNFGA